MWHEARRQERKIRGMLVDYRKRAERRRDFYERIKADPTQFLQVHGRQCKIHLDPAIAAAADSTVMMPWQGNDSNLIDRFDVRAHLDIIPPLKKDEEVDITQEERHLNYERYRIIAQNAYLAISEEKFLKQLHLEEQFGYTETKAKKEPKAIGAAIGFNYEEGIAITAPPPTEPPDENFDEDNSDSDLDVDLAINVSKIDSAQAHEMNKHGQQFGMAGNDFYSFLTNDLEEAESYKLAKEEEHEKALYSGRKSRRERRAHREKRLANRKISPPSYAAKESPTNLSLRDESKSPSRSPSIDGDAGKITYITSFGDDEETPSSSKPTYADKVKYGKPRRGASSLGKRNRSSSRELSFDRRRRSGSRYRRSRSRSRSRRSRSRTSRNKSRSRSRTRRERPSTAYSPHPKRRRSTSRSGSRSAMAGKGRSISKSRSRSPRKGLARSRSSSAKAKRSTNSRRSRSRSTNNSRSKRSSRSLSRSRSRSRSLEPRQKLLSNRSRSASSSSLSMSSSGSVAKSSKSKSKSPVAATAVERRKSDSKSPVAPAPPRIRYYGRKKSDASSSESISSSSAEENEDYEMKSDFPGTSESNRSGNNSGSVSKRPSSALTVIERLKLKRQALINRQFKKDKIAEVQKILREKQAQQTREDELREMAIKLRRRQRELRHAYDRSSNSSDSEKSDSSNKKKADSVSPSRNRESTKSDRDRDRDNKDKRDKDRRRSTSRDRSRRNRSRDRARRSSRSRSPSRKRFRDERDRSPPDRESTRKLVDY